MRRFKGRVRWVAAVLLAAAVFAAGRWSAAETADTLHVTLTVYDAAGQAVGSAERQVRPKAGSDAWECGGRLPETAQGRYVLRVRPASSDA